MSENIKIHGIAYKKDENTNEINDIDLSTSHRLMSRKMNSQINPSNRDTKVPMIMQE